MFLKQPSVSYRMKKSRVGKKLKDHTRLLFIVGAALLAAVLTVIWGIVWGEKAQESAQARAEIRLAEQALAADTPEWLPEQPAPIQAYYLGRITSLDAAIADAVSLTEDGAQAISLPLYHDGAPRYSSGVAQALGRQTVGETDVTLSRLFAAILADECTVAATFSCSWQSENNTAMRRVLRAYEAALIAEIAESGADEVMLLDLTVNADTIDETALFLREVRENCPDAVIGVGVSTAAMLDDMHIEWARALLTWADHIALDLGDSATHTVTETAEDGTPRRSTATVGQILALLDPAVSRYRMRLLLPSGMYEQLAAIEELGYESWQIIR